MAFDEMKHARSGRTTRMLQEAIQLSLARRAVYVVGLNAAHARVLAQRLEELNPPEGHGIQFGDANMIRTLDWYTLTLDRAHPNCVVLVDHAVIEQRYRAVLRMLHRFDADEPDDEDVSE